MTPISILEQFLQDNPDIEMFEVLLHDLNGVQRGKWLPRDKIHKVSVRGNVHSRGTGTLRRAVTRS